MMSKIVAIASIVCLSTAVKQYVATFDKSNNGIGGTVTVDNGQIKVDIDLSDKPDFGISGVNFSACTKAGLAYHIHYWFLNDTDEKIGGDCGKTNTGGHWDPWQACGGATGNSYCGNPVSTDACIPKGDIKPYEPDLDADPFSVEVGDWSGKYSKLELDTDMKISRTDSSFYEVLPQEMDELSVVFHCSSDGAPRAFCAPLLAGSTDASATVPDQDEGNPTVVADFGDVLDGTESRIMLYPNGNVSVKIDATGTDGAAAVAAAGCTSFDYSIFNAGSLTAAAGGDDCEDIGMQYDPTIQCLPWSEQTDYCTDGVLCDGQSNSNYTYECDFTDNRYSCAPGDLSGKMGMITTGSAYTKEQEGPTTLIPPTDSLIGKVIAITCPYTQSATRKYLACAEIEEYSMRMSTTDITMDSTDNPMDTADTTMDTTDTTMDTGGGIEEAGVEQISFLIVFIVASFTALLF